MTPKQQADFLVNVMYSEYSGSALRDKCYSYINAQSKENPEYWDKVKSFLHV